ncbi:MAG: formate dehydrogenase accessory sulfurtransferase FdhD [Lachnospiraceae bacterium]|nr:formate dehydrogenase accessory sulfurtransferase FdhD [Lachnospiraceae bacterium]
MEKEKIIIRRVKGDTIFAKEDEVAVEYQLDIPLTNGKVISVTCTPTYLEEMILARKYLAGDLKVEKPLVESDSCQGQEGLKCVNLEEIFRIAKDSFENPGPLFTETGCAHSCALIYQGEVKCCIEDIGRHNALDKVIGYALRYQIPIEKSYVFSSGRISGDYLQKVIAAGFPMAVSRAAVTDQAVKLAKEHDITMLGFIRKNTGNLYHEGTVKICNDLKECHE